MAEQTDSDTTIAAVARQSWPAARTVLAWSGAGMLVVLLIVEGLLLRRWLALPVGVTAVVVGLGALVGAAAIVALALRFVSCLTLRYVLDQQTVTIIRGTAHWVVPLCAVEQVYVGEPRAVVVDSEALPGFTVGRGYVPDSGKVLFFTTLPNAVSVALRTSHCTYLLSPSHAGQFVAAVEARRAQAGPVAAREPGPGFLVILRQPWAMLLAAGAIAANAALQAYMAWWYPAFPSSMPLHFAANGLADRWGQALALFWLPRIGAIVIATNLLLSVLPPLRRPAHTAVLLAAALLAQVLLWVAFLRLLP